MRSFWSDPYLWVHLAGVAAVPMFLAFCLLGLAVGEPSWPLSVEVAIVAIAGVVPVLWMQWRSPFYIFSLLAIALRPTRLTEDQRRILRQFKTPLVKILTTLTAGILVVLLWQLEQLAPLASVNSPWPEDRHWVGLIVAALAFLGANLFSQVPASVAAVLMTSKRAFASVKPYPVEDVFKDFTVLGFPVRQVLPPSEPLSERLADSFAVPEPSADAAPSETPEAPSAASSAPVQSESAPGIVDIPDTDVVELSPEQASGPTLPVEPAVDDLDTGLDAVLNAEFEGLSESLSDAFSDLDGETLQETEPAVPATPPGQSHAEAVAPDTVEPSPVESSTVGPSAVEPDSVEPDPVEPDPVEPDNSALESEGRSPDGSDIAGHLPLREPPSYEDPESEER
jgi:hypothetical protein